MPQAESLRREVLRVLAGSGGAQVAGTLLGFVVGVLLARGLGVGGYGLYGSAMAAAGLGVTVASGGLQLHATRQIARFLAADDPGAASVVLAWSIRGLLWMLPATAFIVVWYVLLLQDASFELAAGAGLVTISMGLLTLVGAALRGGGRAVFGLAIDFMLRPAAQCLFLLVAMLFFVELTPSFALYLSALAALVVIIPAIGPLSALVGLASTRATANHIETGQWRREAFSMGLATVLRAAELALPVIIIGALSGPEETGIFRVALSAVILPDLAVSLVMIVAPAMLARLHALGDHHGLRQLVSVFSFAMALPTVFIASILWVFGAPILELAFGADYRDAALPLGILAVGSLVTATGGASVALLHAGHQQDVVTRAFGVSLVIVVPGAWCLAPHMGAQGVAIASLLAVIARTIYLTVKSRSSMGIDPSLFAAAKQLLWQKLDR